MNDLLTTDIELLLSGIDWELQGFKVLEKWVYAGELLLVNDQSFMSRKILRPLASVLICGETL